MIETSNASTGDVLDKTTLETLPSISRMAFLVGNTVPTVTYTGNPHMNRMQDQTEASRMALGGGISVSKQLSPRRLSDHGSPEPRLRQPQIEALEDVKVQVHTYDAEMGRTGGGMFNATAKSGSNRIHGGGFLLMRPGSLIGQNFFLKLQGRPQPNEFWRNLGGGFGGP